ncbi:MAG: magnesium transporter CorA family protein [bacterium]|nr:magnesium transporter CorA family protein [bacterium]
MRIIKQKIIWLDFISPVPQDLEYLSQTFHFHPVTLEELAQPSTRSNVEHYEDYLFLALHFPIYDAALKTSRPIEVDVLLTKTHFITIRYEKLQPVDDFFEKCQRDSGLRERCLNETSGHLLYYFIEEMLNFSMRQLDHIVKKIEQIEDKIFKGLEREMIHEISIVKRDILDFRRIVKPYNSIFESLISKGQSYFGRSLRIYFQDIHGDYLRVWNAVENYKETIESLETTNSALLETKINEVMKILTLLAFIAIPLTVVSQILSINTIDSFLNNYPWSFLVIILATIVLQIGLFIFFRKRKWL